jgi:hypothetical protein
MDSAKERFNVESVISKDDEGVPTFNGKSRRIIVDLCYINLNYYQMACKPRILNEDVQADSDDEYIDEDLFHRIKDAALLCPVCYDVYKTPLTVRQCLHKFCSACIEDYNRKVKKECPGCRQPIGSRRLLRQDVKTANIINALVSDIEEFNRVEQRTREEEVKKFDYQGFTQRMAEGQGAQDIAVMRDRMERLMKQRKNRQRVKEESENEEEEEE